MPNNPMPELGRTVLVGSGAMGTVLRSQGAMPDGPVELLNLRRPDAVKAVHDAYRRAGSQVLVTNTFAAHSLALTEAGIGETSAEIVRAGVALAREAAGDACAVWVSLGPLALGLRHDDFSADDLLGFYRDPCAAAAGADAIVLETFTDPREAAAALAASAATGLPVIFQIGNIGGGRERWNRVDALLDLALGHGVKAVGTNCRHPGDVVLMVEHLAVRTALPLTAAPNAGHPGIERGLVKYEYSPQDFRKVAEQLLAAGAAVIGGCCGTTPDHIRQLTGAVRGQPVRPRPAAEVREKESREVAGAAAVRVNRVRDLVASRKLVISVEIRAERRRSLDQIVAGAAQVAAAGADMFDVPDNPGATVGRDAMVVAARLQEQLGKPAICHKSVTQSNLLQLHSSLMGCWDLGLQGVLAVTGDPPSMGHLGGMAKLVSDLKSSVELLRLIRRLRDGRMMNDEEVADPPDFCAGCAIGRASAPQVNWLKKKIEAGAEFVFSQPVFTRDDFRELYGLVSALPVRFFPGVMPLTGLKNAEALAGGRIPGIRIPEKILDDFRARSSEADQRRFGLECAAELARAVAEEAGSLYLIMPFGKRCFEETADIVRAVREGLQP